VSELSRLLRSSMPSPPLSITSTVRNVAASPSTTIPVPTLSFTMTRSSVWFAAAAPGPLPSRTPVPKLPTCRFRSVTFRWPGRTSTPSPLASASPVSRRRRSPPNPNPVTVALLARTSRHAPLMLLRLASMRYVSPERQSVNPQDVMAFSRSAVGEYVSVGFSRVAETVFALGSFVEPSTADQLPSYEWIRAVLSTSGGSSTASSGYWTVRSTDPTTSPVTTAVVVSPMVPISRYGPKVRFPGRSGSMEPSPTPELFPAMETLVASSVRSAFWIASPETEVVPEPVVTNAGAFPRTRSCWRVLSAGDSTRMPAALLSCTSVSSTVVPAVFERRTP